MSVRLPCVAGQFYEGSEARLLKQVTACLPKACTKRRATALVVPHAGLTYSGRVAGETYASLEWTSTAILLGTNHTGEGKPFGLSPAARWRTPLGDVEVDRELSKALLEHAPELEQDETSHRFEHSLEVQLPFLRLLSSHTKIIPISVGLSVSKTYQAFGEHLAFAVDRAQKEVVVIASSDFTHYEPQASAQEKDHAAIQTILSLDPDALSREVRSRDITMCGYAPVTAMLSYAKKRKASGGELLRYQTSGDVSGDYTSVVGYAGIRIH